LRILRKQAILQGAVEVEAGSSGFSLMLRILLSSDTQAKA
jgi:hypothetical protein